MAGGDHNPFKTDPAIERWSEMHATMYQRFRMTPLRTRQVILWGLTIPLLTYYAATATDDKWELRGRLRNETLLRDQQASEVPDKK